MIKCKIGWVDANGVHTHDTNDAIGYAVSYDPVSFGEKGSEKFPICAEHANIKGKFWKVIPLEGQDISTAHELVRYDQYFQIIPDIVTQSVRKSFPNDWMNIMNKIICYGDHWGFTHNEVFFGVEISDGYLHS